MSDTDRKPPHVTFLVLGSLLAAVTYLESALLEYPPHWLGPASSLAVLALLVAAQAMLCVFLYRHLRRNNDAYSTFFNRATLLALAAYLTLTALFLLPHGVSFVSHDLGSLAVITPTVSA